MILRAAVLGYAQRMLDTVATTPPRVRIDDAELPVRLRRHPRARRLILRLEPDGEGVRVTLPPGVSEAAGLAFVREHAGWIARERARAHTRVPFADGATIPIRGEPHQIRHRPDARRGVWCAGDILHVSGDAAHIPRRVGDFLKREARAAIQPQAHALAARLDNRPKRITLRDTRSRWGSCSHQGGLNFSWRLILAPPPVLTYVVAHEVAHLRHMNHGPDFWHLTATLFAHATGQEGADAALKAARDWLRRHGAGLTRYG